MEKIPLDIYDDMPKPMKRYIAHFGWHFNKAAFQDAIKKMWKEDAAGRRIKIEYKSKEQVEEILKKHGIDLKYNTLYDAAYTYHMVMADYMGVSVDDERHVALSVKAIIDDPDKHGGNVFRHWYVDMVADGEGIDFEDYLDD